MSRQEPSNEQFAKIEHLLPGRVGHVGVKAKDNGVFEWCDLDILITTLQD